MLRPPRRDKVESDGLARGGKQTQTSLSNSIGGAEEHDGRHMRRRYVFFFGLGLLVVSAGIAALVVGTSGGDNANTSGNGGGGDDSIPAPSPTVTSDAYTQTSKAFIETHQANVQVLKHDKSGMTVMTMIPTKDTTNDATFGLNFRTIPDNHHGTAHIVEHALFDGSNQYPVKDVLNQLERGSLQTHMDTFTGKDRTSFVVSSRNKADFVNSMKVYLDAVFHPNFVHPEGRWIFRQEGWRLEIVNNTNVIIKGNAVNEARAAQSNPHINMMDYFYQELFPKNCYKYDPHGKAKDIVQVSHEEMIDFYHQHYHPSNGQAFCYGPQSFVDECLSILDPVLSEFTADPELRKATQVEWQSKDRIISDKAKIPYASIEDTDDFRLAIGWLLNDDIMDVKTQVAWQLIEELLIGTRVAAISKVVGDLNLGEDIIGGLDKSSKQWSLILGVSGIRAESEGTTAANAINDKLLAIVEGGFSENALMAALNKMEYKFRDQSAPDGLPRGVSIFHEVLNNLNHDIDPTTTLHYSNVYKLLKQEILEQGPVFLIDLISKNIIDNEHTIALELFPDATLAQYNIDQEQVFINTLGSSITFEERQEIIQESIDLRVLQEAHDTQEALATIPRVKLSDLDKNGFEIVPNIVPDVYDSGITLLEHELEFTDGILYADFAVDISKVDFDDVAVLPLLCALLQEAGTTAKSDVFVQREADTYTGGITVTPFVEEVLIPSSDNGYVVPVETKMITKIMVRGSAIAAEGLPLFNLMQDFIYDTDLESNDTKRKAIQIIKKTIGDMEDEILIRGHHYTTVRIESRYSLPAFVREQWEGMSQLMKLRELKDLAVSDWSSLSTRLLTMADAVRNSNRNGMFLSIAGDAESIAAVAPSIQIFVRDVLPPARGIPVPDFAQVDHPWAAKGLELMKSTYNEADPNEAFMAPTRVNHVGKGGIMFDEGERIYGYDQVVVHYIGGHYLYNQLRYTVGAEQAWAELDLDSGVLVYQSDRDPSIVDTLDIFEGGANFVYQRMTEAAELPIEAVASIVGVIGSIDGTAWQPREVSFASLRQMLQQETPEMRQQWRKEVLGTTQDNFIAMVERLGAWGKTSICAVTSEPLYAVAESKGLNLTTCDYTGYQC